MNLKARLAQFSKTHSEQALSACRDLMDRVEKGKRERIRDRVFRCALWHKAKAKHNG